MSALDSWTLGSHTADGVTHPTYRKGRGPGVIVIHEIPGITPAVLAFAEEVVERGFTVVMPSLFGRPEAPATVSETVRSIVGVCVSREFTMFAMGRTSPVAAWLRSLARELHSELGGPGVGAVGMCLTGPAGLARSPGQETQGRPRTQSRRPRVGQGEGRGRLPGARAAL